MLLFRSSHFYLLLSYLILLIVIYTKEEVRKNVVPSISHLLTATLSYCLYIVFHEYILPSRYFCVCPRVRPSVYQGVALFLR